MQDKTINSDVTMMGASTGVPGGRFRAGDSILGRYTVLGEFGQGGMGVVYRCLDTVGGVEVAVKGLPPEVSHNADEMDAIRANYQLVRTLRHPNIVGVTNLEQDAAGDYYLVMDVARGENLNRWMRRHTGATREEKLAILRQIASALDHAHAKKIIHRDVKPENVMVDEAGNVKVLDFGLAAEIRSSQSRTSNTVTSRSGTPHYKAPEQWLGRPQRAPADLYSFAVLTWKLFTGELPFDADDLGVLGQAVLSAPVPKLDGVPAYVNAAFTKALAKKPEDRFTTCAAFVDALAGTMKVSAAGGRGKWIVFGALALALVGGACWYGVQRAQARRAETARQVAVARAQRDQAAKEAAAREKAEQERLAAEQAAREKAEAEAKAAREKLAKLEAAQEEERARRAAEAENKRVTTEGGGSDDGAAAEVRRKELKALADARTRIGIKRDRAEELKRKVEPFRGEREGFEAHLAAFDAAAEKLAAVSDPQTTEEARTAVAAAAEQVDMLEVELKWLADNRAGRDAAKRVAAEIARDLDAELERFKAREIATVAFKTGDALRKRGQTALAQGAFADAGRDLEAAKEKLAAALAEAKAFQVSLSLDAAKSRKEAGQWEKCLEEVEKALAIDIGNAEAQSLKAEVSSHLLPSLKLVTKIAGMEVTGATIRIGETAYTSPATFEKLEKDVKHGPYAVTFERNGTRYRGRFLSIDVDWVGPKTFSLTLQECTEPEPGEKKTVTLPGGAELTLVWCPAGTDLKGNAVKGFWMGQTEVTQAQWTSVMRENPSRFTGDDQRPVEKVSWNDCQSFCKKVGQGLRLPTEREWEYACRAGSTGDWGRLKDGTEGTLEAMGWFYANSENTTHPVAKKIPNAWGLYDMHGNVWEWCEDAVGELRVRRGGGWSGVSWICSAGYRYGDWHDPDDRSYFLGFRLALSQD